MSRAQYPLHDSTYHAYKASPLYTPGRLLAKLSLQLHASRLRDALKGDRIRGVEIGAPSETSIANLGPLESCQWDLLGDETSWDAAQQETAQDDEMSDDLAPGAQQVSAEDARGIHIQLQYARQTHTALLLRDPDVKAKVPDQFAPFPLLLLRMPQPLREAVVSYLTTAFDTRIAPLALTPTFLTSSLESLLTFLFSDETPSIVPDTLKNLQLQLSFPAAAPLLKNIDITISRDDVASFHTHGSALLTSQPNLYPSITTPFTAALVHYLTTHLALSATHILPSISKITCGVFALSSYGKLKLTPGSAGVSDTASSVGSAPNARRRARERERSIVQTFTSEFYKSLVAEAAPKGLSGATTARAKTKVAGEKARGKRAMTAESDRVSVAGVRKRGRPRRSNVEEAGVSTEGLPLDPPPPYELHDPVRVGAR